MNEQPRYNFGLADKIEARLQDIQSGKELPISPAAGKTEPKTARTIGGLPAEDFGKLLTAVEEKAALSGCFEPDAIVGGDVQTSVRLLLLTRLVPDCIVQTTGERASWILKQDRRKTILTQLINSNTLQEKLAQPLPETDKLGFWLRQVLRGEPVPDLQQLDRDELLALAHAAEALSGVPGVTALPELSDIVRNLETGRFLADYDILLLNGFLGREKELDRLGKFLEEAKPQYGLWEGILLTGMGGAGKSTLLAKFVRDQATKNTCTVGVLDFDRPAISPEDTTWLEMELSRQIGQQYPDTSSELSQLRKQTRVGKSRVNENLSKADEGYRSQLRGLRNIVGEIGRLLKEKKVDHLPFLLVLDTFEEVAQRNLTASLLSWLGDLAERLYPQRLKVIISGRLFDSTLKPFENYKLEQLTVNELEPLVARQLLINRGVKEDAADKLVTSGGFPLRPLELKLLAKVITSDTGFSLQSLTGELPTNEAASQQLFAGIVYRRVLLRIQDEVVRTLASPGLVLHYVTKDLVQQVMVPALKMAPLSDEQANKALDTLASYEWLAHRETDGSVWHSREIRRSMLKVMMAYEPEKTRAIQEYAIRYFSKKSSSREQAEAIYHRLMLVKDIHSVLPDRSELMAVSQVISSYQEELPKTAAVFFKYITQGRIDVDDLPWMPAIYSNEATNNTGSFLCDNRQLGAALALIKTLNPDSQLVRESWVVDTLFATAEWELFKEWYPTDANTTGLNFLQAVDNLFFAASVISIDLLNPIDFQQAVTGFFNLETIDKNMAPSQSMISVTRMVFTLVSIHREQDLLEDCILMMRRLIHSINESNYFRSKQLGAAPGLKRNLFLLNLALRDQQPLICLMDLSLFNLDNDWLNFLLQKKAGIEMDAAVENLLQQVVAAINDFSHNPRKTAEGLLAKIDDLHKDDGQELRITLYTDQLAILDLLSFLKGGTAEFRDPSRFALLEAFTDYAAYQQLAGIFASLFPWKLDDLEPDVFAANMSTNAEHTLENYIELTDRCGKLDELLRAASAAWPKAPKLQLVWTAYIEWQIAIVTAAGHIRPADVEGETSQTADQHLAKPFPHPIKLKRSTTKTDNMKAITIQHPVALKEMVRLGDLAAADRIEAPGHEPVSSPEEFEDRQGYDPTFLDGFHIALPAPAGDRAADMTSLLTGSGVELKYHHFSVIMSKSKRMPMLTAVNINGEESRKVPRISTWSYDGRIDKKDQWGDELYFQNDLDRGHMVRREDPVWGDTDDAKKANSDTFHFTNSCPQMAAVNQKTWVGLENYVLSHARADGMRVTVFTGPIFSDTDMEYRGAKIPKAFWKVVAIVTETGRPSATAYKVSQEKELEELEFVYAGYKTYQISIRQVIKLSSIDFSDLLPYDGFSQHEAAGGEELNERLESLENIRI